MTLGQQTRWPLLGTCKFVEVALKSSLQPCNVLAINISSGHWYLRFTSFREIRHHHSRFWQATCSRNSWRRLQRIAVLVHIGCICYVFQPPTSANDTNKLANTTRRTVMSVTFQRTRYEESHKRESYYCSDCLNRQSNPWGPPTLRILALNFVYSDDARHTPLFTLYGSFSETAFCVAGPSIRNCFPR